MIPIKKLKKVTELADIFSKIKIGANKKDTGRIKKYIHKPLIRSKNLLSLEYVLEMSKLYFCLYFDHMLNTKNTT